MIVTGRLFVTAKLIPHGKTFADIGTDHAYIPIYMCQKQYTPRAIAADIRLGPLQAAQAHIREFQLEERITCRLGDGLTCIQQGEVEGAVIAGMGGYLIRDILAKSISLWQTFSFMVLQPMRDAIAVRRFISEHDWHIEDEILVQDGHLYDVMRVCPGKGKKLSYGEMEVGPINWQRQDKLVERKLYLLISQKKRILHGFQRSRQNMEEKIRKLQWEVEQLEAMKWQLP